jgi:hypothetical protein
MMLPGRNRSGTIYTATSFLVRLSMRALGHLDNLSMVSNALARCASTFAQTDKRSLSASAKSDATIDSARSMTYVKRHATAPEELALIASVSKPFLGLLA